jgi:multisubunit Na+/H+ antiporter MnhB subunit
MVLLLNLAFNNDNNLREYQSMQPLAVLIGILTGSAVAIAISLILTAVVLMFLPEYAERFAVEWPPLRRATLLFATLAVVCACSFYAELKSKRWRSISHITVVLGLAVLVWIYWPQPQ